MKNLFCIIIFLSLDIGVFAQHINSFENAYVTYVVEPKKQEIKLYWKNENQQIFQSIENLKNWVELRKQKLIFAMNAGMYQKDNSPLGLFIYNKNIITPLNKKNGSGNFYLKPNGVFCITGNNIATICSTPNFVISNDIKYATQSGPMLVIDGEINNLFKEGSANVNIRNGVGILPDNRVIFVMSKREVSFYEFASFFKNMGCKNALYLDGFVSKTYLPAKNWIQTDGNFGVIVAITEAKD